MSPLNSTPSNSFITSKNLNSPQGKRLSEGKSDFRRSAIIAALAFMLVGSLSYIAMQSVAPTSNSITQAQLLDVSALAPAPTRSAVQTPPQPNPRSGLIEPAAFPENAAAAPTQDERAFVTDNGAIDVVETEVEPYFVFASTRIAESKAPNCVTTLRGLSSEAKFYFDVGSAQLNDRDLVRLAKLGRLVNDCPEAMVHVTGHSDTSGSDLTNLDLSWKRADSTVNALVELGIDISQFEPVGFGARAPLGQGDTSDEKQNRRVEFQVLHHGPDH